MERLIEGLGTEILRFLQIGGAARLLELQGDYQQAIVGYERVVSLQPTASSIYIDIGRCYRKLGDLATAEANLRRALKVQPYDGRVHLELARVYVELGDREKAADHLQTALNIWENADPGYARAIEARRLLSDL